MTNCTRQTPTSFIISLSLSFAFQVNEIEELGNVLGQRNKEQELLLKECDSLDDVFKFYLTSKLLPEASRYRISPESGYDHSFMVITEDALLEALPLAL
jgi:hypothetical protein